MDGQLELWTQIIQESNSLSDPLFLECIESGNNTHIFTRISDDDLKTILGVVNKLLNDPKSRSRGMAVIERLLSHIATSRFIVFQDSIISAFHMIMKDIDSIGTFNVLVKILPICKQLPDVNQTITSTVVPKILSIICNESADSEPSIEEISLLKICLEKYHGPCGNYRSQLEKRLLLFIDSPNLDIKDVIPLLSSAGGGGTKGDKHGQDWNEMVIKINCSTYDTLYALYSDACPVLEEENPFKNQYSKLNVPAINEQRVFVRISLLKNRVVNLCDLLGAFLCNPFSAPKPVPVKSILRLISNMLLLNPVDLLKKSQFSTPKEFYFLASVLPSIHEASFKLLKNLMLSVGTNLFPDASRIEQMFLQQFKWMSTEQQSYNNLKVEVYRALVYWMKITKNSATTNKCASTMVEFIAKDIQIEKETVKLNASVGAGKSKHNKNRKSSSDFAHNVSLSSGNTSYALKSPDTTSFALELIARLIPCLEHSNFVTIYQLIAKTVLVMTQSGTPPSPYNSQKCRLNLYNCVLALAINPHPQSSSSLTLLSNLTRQGVDDPSPSVSTLCHQIMSTLERLIHPICPSMDFVNVSMPSSTSTEMETSSLEMDMNVTVEDETEMFEVSCQTDISELPPPTSAESSFAETSIFSTPVASFNNVEFKKLIAEAIRENIGDLASTPRPQRQAYTNGMESDVITKSVTFASPNKPMFPPASSPPISSLPIICGEEKEKPRTNGNDEGEGKRKCNDQVHSEHEEEQLTTKRQKISTEDSAEVEEMLSSFVDIGCNEN